VERGESATLLNMKRSLSSPCRGQGCVVVFGGGVCGEGVGGGGIGKLCSICSDLMGENRHEPLLSQQPARNNLMASPRTTHQGEPQYTTV
jgi:hypothetical protein